MSAAQLGAELVRGGGEALLLPRELDATAVTIAELLPHRRQSALGDAHDIVLGAPRGALIQIASIQVNLYLRIYV